MAYSNISLILVHDWHPFFLLPRGERNGDDLLDGLKIETTTIALFFCSFSYPFSISNCSFRKAKKNPNGKGNYNDPG